MLKLDNTVYLGKAVPSSGGGSIDESKIIIKTDTMSASADSVGKIYIFSGTSISDYKHGYIYEGISIPANTETVTFNSAEMSCSGANFWSFVKNTVTPSNYAKITKGTMQYFYAGDLWKFTGIDTNNEVVATYQQYTSDFEQIGFTMPADPSDGDIISLECQINDTGSTVYKFKRIDVQPAGAGSSYQLPVATDSVLGGIIVGDGLSITAQGVLSLAGGASSILVEDYTE